MVFSRTRTYPYLKVLSVPIKASETQLSYKTRLWILQQTILFALTLSWVLSSSSFYDKKDRTQVKQDFTVKLNAMSSQTRIKKYVRNSMTVQNR